MFLRYFRDVLGEPVPGDVLDALVAYARKIPAAERDRLILAGHASDRMNCELFVEDLMRCLRDFGQSVPDLETR